jgi:NTP-dependent ternary system trypsin peptidase co-occuring protein
MRVTDSGVPVQDLIQAVKQAIKAANVSRTTHDRDLRIRSARLTLHAVATRSYGGGLNFQIPFIGTEIKMGGKLSRQDTHEIEIILVPPAPEERPELRDGDIGTVLVEAIETIRATLAAASGGEDPFVLDEGTITIAFGVTADGDISIGVNGSLSDELTQTLALALISA